MVALSPCAPARARAAARTSLPLRPVRKLAVTASWARLAAARPSAQARRRVALAGAQHVSELLGVGVEAEIGDAEIGPEHVAGLDDRVALERLRARRWRKIATEGWNQVSRPSAGDPLAIPPDEVVGGGPAGPDRAARKALGDDRMGDAHDLGIARHLRRECGSPASRWRDRRRARRARAGAAAARSISS